MLKDLREPNVTLSHMNQFLSFVFVFLVISHSSFAAKQDKKVNAVRIDYQRSIPFAVSSQMPPGAKSCFYGAFHLANQRPRFALHLFDPDPKATASADRYSRKVALKLHLFEWQSTTRKSKQHLRLLNIIPVQYNGIINKPVRFGADLLWLDPDEKNQPIVKFQCFEPHGFSGLIGDEVIVIFPNGLEGKTVVQAFAYGAWRSSDSSGQANSFDKVGPDGLIEIRSHTFIPTSEIPSPPPIVYEWNGENFAPIEDKNADGK